MGRLGRVRTVKEWGVPCGFGAQAAPQTIRGHELAYYLDRLREGRQHTLAGIAETGRRLVNANRQPLALGTDAAILIASGSTCRRNTNPITTDVSSGSRAAAVQRIEVPSQLVGPCCGL